MSEAQLRLLSDLQYELTKAERRGEETTVTSLKSSIQKLQDSISRYAGQVATNTATAKEAVVTRTSNATALVESKTREVLSYGEQLRRDQDTKLRVAEAQTGKPLSKVDTYISTVGSVTNGSADFLKSEIADLKRQNQQTSDFLAQLLADDGQTMGQQYNNATINLITQLEYSESESAKAIDTGLSKIASNIWSSVKSVADDTLTGLTYIGDWLWKGWEGLVSTLKTSLDNAFSGFLLGFIDWAIAWEKSQNVTEEQLELAMVTQMKVAERVAKRMQDETLRSRFV